MFEEDFMNILRKPEMASINDDKALRSSDKFGRVFYIFYFLCAVSLFALTGCNPSTGNLQQVKNDTPQMNNNSNSNGNNANTGAVYETYGVHNDPSISPCASRDCIYTRGPGEPENPIYPEYWVSDWNMYRVYNNYSAYPPPYVNAPPPQLKEGVDYEKSTGTTYYDSTWSGPGGNGAMMEYYEARCLPIFPISNKFTCAFISLGKTAYFVTYEKDRPQGMPPVCLFSSFNHPPARDFIKHLPYSKEDSTQIGEGGQGYSFWVSANDGKPIQTGVKPDRTADQAIMFGYGFAPKDGQIMPQSFYFSGYPLPPANAPFVSQNYTDFKAVKPDPAKTWDQVKNLDPATLPQCQLFNPPQNSNGLKAEQKQAPTWGDIGRWNKK